MNSILDNRWIKKEYKNESKLAVRYQPGFLTCILAHFFLCHGKIRSGKKTPASTLSQFGILLGVVLPLRTFNIDAAVQLVGCSQ